jgi:hypothetical protein
MGKLCSKCFKPKQKNVVIVPNEQKEINLTVKEDQEIEEPAVNGKVFYQFTENV